MVLLGQLVGVDNRPCFFTKETIEEVYEPFLIQQGFIMRTPRGREATNLAYKHLNREKDSPQKGLF